jgi:E3 ubiquitin ligase SMURF1/2
LTQCFLVIVSIDQRLDLHKFREEDQDIVRGQIVISLLSRDGSRAAGGRLQNVVISDSGNSSAHSHNCAIINDDLPDGWTECRTSSGRVYYVNHEARATQWDKPTNSSLNDTRRNNHNVQQSNTNNNSSNNGSNSNTNTNNNNSNSELSSVRSQQRRSTRHRNYLARNQLHEAVLTATSSTSNGRQSPNGHQSPTQNQTQSEMCTNNANSNNINLPQGYEMRTTPQGQVYFYQVDTGVSTWHDPRVPRELIQQGINLDELIGPLLNGWEIRQTQSGRQYYVDHNNRTTQFTDPRLVANSLMLQNLLK